MAENKEKTKGKGDKLKLVIIVLLVLIFVGASSFAAWYIFFNKNTQNEANASTTKIHTNAQNTLNQNDPNLITFEESEFNLPMDKFLVNLSDEGGKRYLDIKMVLGYNTKEKKKFPKELDDKKHVLRDTINTALRSRKSTDFTAKGLDDLKKEIINRVNANLEFGKINNVFITDIIVQ